jgi:BASS family bile acid:Na+ symporter
MSDKPFLIALAVALPIAMFLLGMQLTVGDFREALAQRRGVLAGLFCQVVLLPLVALLFVTTWPIAAPLKVGVVVVASTPGGPASNTISYLGRGNLPLAILLTVGTSVLAVLTIPLVVNGGLAFLHYDRVTQLPVIPTILRSVLLILVPVGLGVAVRARKPELMARTERFTKRFTASCIVLLIAYGVYSHWDVFHDHFDAPVVGGALLFSAMMMIGAFLCGRVFGLSARDRYTVAVESVVHNSVLSLLIVTILEIREAIVFSAYFGVFSIAVGVALSGLLRPGGALNPATTG